MRPVTKSCCLAVTLMLLSQQAAAQQYQWPAPKLTDDNLQQWMTFIRPTKKELKWRKIRWHKSLSVAAREAKRLKKLVSLQWPRAKKLGYQSPCLAKWRPLR